MLKTAWVTIVVCVLAVFLLVSLMSSNQAGRERRRQEAIRELDRRNAEEAPAMAAGVASAADRAKQAQRDLDTDQAIANLRSSDREVLNEAIQKIQSRRACKAVPDLMDTLRKAATTTSRASPLRPSRYAKTPLRMTSSWTNFCAAAPRLP